MGWSRGLWLGACSLLLNILWVLCIPPVQSPDEPSHLLAVYELRERGRLPEIHFQLDAAGVPVEPVGAYSHPDVLSLASAAGITDYFRQQPYESSQPPTYYALAAAASAPVAHDPRLALYAARLVSALFGALTVLFVWAAVREMAPAHPPFAILCAGVVALLPQFAFNSAGVGNDSLNNAVCAALLFTLLRGVRRPAFDRWMVLAGALLGLGFISKVSALLLGPAIIATVLLRARSAAHFARMAAGASVGALAVGGWLAVRNLVEYGEWTGSAEVLRWYAERLPNLTEIGAGAKDRFLWESTTSLIGRFSWMDRTLPTGYYWLGFGMFGLLLLLTLSNLPAIVRRARACPVLLRQIAICAATVAAVVVAYIQFTLSVAYQPQGRYLFPALVPLAVLFCAGLYRVSVRVPRRLGLALRAVPLLVLTFLQGVSLMVVAGG
jgi:4-amino-4-deoxy-L-arabinose transferase-like glycosyltransferase